MASDPSGLDLKVQWLQRGQEISRLQVRLHRQRMSYRRLREWTEKLQEANEGMTRMQEGLRHSIAAVTVQIERLIDENEKLKGRNLELEILHKLTSGQV